MDYRKDLLFYSNFCEHCKKLVGFLIKQNLREQFILVCVDKKEFKIPSFIDRVPSILNIKKELYTEESIYAYVDTKLKIIKKQVEEIAPFTMMGGLNSSQYTFISNDGEGYDTGCDLRTDLVQSHDFVLLNHDQRIIAPVDKEADSKSGSKFDSSVLERYMDSRKRDDEIIKKTCADQQGLPPR